MTICVKCLTDHEGHLQAVKGAVGVPVAILPKEWGPAEPLPERKAKTVLKEKATFSRWPLSFLPFPLQRRGRFLLEGWGALPTARIDRAS
jgi:hypothetical protein